MAEKTYVVLGALIVGMLFGASGPAQAVETTAAAPELVPLPAPQPLPSAASPQYQPEATYGPLQPGSEGYQTAEQARRSAIDRQRQLQRGVCVYRPWRSYVDRFALPYIYAYAPPRVAGLVHWELDRHVPGAVFVPQPRVLGNSYVPPYNPGAQQPLGHEKTWTGPNGYVYRPRYGQPVVAGPVPTPAVPQKPTPAAPRQPTPAVPVSGPGGPLVGAVSRIPVSPVDPALESIPAPPNDSGPREF